MMPRYTLKHHDVAFIDSAILRNTLNVVYANYSSFGKYRKASTRTII